MIRIILVDLLGTVSDGNLSMDTYDTLHEYIDLEQLCDMNIALYVHPIGITDTSWNLQHIRKRRERMSAKGSQTLGPIQGRKSHLLVVDDKEVHVPECELIPDAVQHEADDDNDEHRKPITFIEVKTK